MLKMNLITQNELCGEVYWEVYGGLDRELCRILSMVLYWQVCGELDRHVWGELCRIRADFSLSKISRV